METMEKIDVEELGQTKEFEGHVAPKKFDMVEYDSFKVETCIDENGEDATIHFYPKDDSDFHPLFAQTLDIEARTYFNATFPQIKAAYTRELNSWWLSLTAFPVLDIAAYINAFYTRLQAALRSIPETSSMS